MTRTPNRSGRHELIPLAHDGDLGHLHGADDVGAVDVDVEDADRCAVLCQRDREVGGHSRLSDAALAAVDADLAADSRQAIGY